MKHARLCATLLVLGTAAQAADSPDPRIEDFALCRESWFDLQHSDPARLEGVRTLLGARFVHRDGDPFMTPRAATTAFGLKVLRVYPSSVGMGLGFSLSVDATFDEARRALERELGKPMQHCEDGDGMRECELQLAEKRTLMVASDDAELGRPALIGCYYYYEK